MVCFVAAWLCSGVGVDTDAYAELVEVNHYMASDGTETFRQVIAWDWSPEYGRWHAQQWAIASDFDRVGKSVYWQGCDMETLGVRFSVFRETWTRHDPERENQKLFDQKFRRKVW